jgi:hypothetical protein
MRLDLTPAEIGQLLSGANGRLAGFKYEQSRNGGPPPPATLVEGVGKLYQALRDNDRDIEHRREQWRIRQRRSRANRRAA